jgi:hypothetical protein
MQRSSISPSTRAAFLGAVILSLAAAVVIARDPSGGDRTEPARDADAARAPGLRNAAPDVAAGVQAYIDPETGLLAVPPGRTLEGTEGGRAALAVEPAEEALVEIPSTVQGGGMMVNLRGRRKFNLTASAQADGATELRCDESAPHAAANPGSGGTHR